MEERAWHEFYEAGVPPDFDFEDVPIARYLDRSATQYPDATALIFMDRAALGMQAPGRRLQRESRCPDFSL